jgi:hypothetical protein
MTELRLHGGGGGGDEDEVTRGLRAIYVAPTDQSYWTELETRIMHRVTDLDLGWWGELDRWARPALIAAALLIMAAGVAMFRAHQTETEMVYEDILAPGPAPVETAVRPTLEGDREATLRYVLGHQGER